MKFLLFFPQYFWACHRQLGQGRRDEWSLWSSFQFRLYSVVTPCSHTHVLKLKRCDLFDLSFLSAANHYYAYSHVYREGKVKPFLSVSFIKPHSRKVCSEQRYSPYPSPAIGPGKKKMHLMVRWKDLKDVAPK
jgi:hypothetical protein